VNIKMNDVVENILQIMF